MTNRPIKQFQSGAMQGAIWLNGKEKEGEKIEYKTASLRRSWKEKETGQWRNEILNLKKSDIPRALVILNKLQEELLLTKAGEDNE